LWPDRFALGRRPVDKRRPYIDYIQLHVCSSTRRGRIPRRVSGQALRDRLLPNCERRSADPLAGLAPEFTLCPRAWTGEGAVCLYDNQAGGYVQ